ncbi:flavonol sulfotransferase-like protein, partial [Trifolium pratense]
MPPRVAPIPALIPPNNSDSFLYVHPSERPNLVTVTPQLTSGNYLAWSHSMCRALGAKNKLALLDRSIPIPDALDLNRSAWERCNHLVHSWIINSVSESIAQTLVFHENAIDAWEDIQERFAKAYRILLWEELNSHRPIPHCTCVHPCRCDAMCMARAYREEDQIIQFLTGLNDHFSVVKTQVLLMDPLPTINKVYSLVVQEESNHAMIDPIVPNSDDSNVLVNASDARKPFNRGKSLMNSGKGKGDTRHCTFCDKNGHTVDWCYKKHGNPNIRSNTGVNLVNSDNVDSTTANGNSDLVASSS